MEEEGIEVALAKAIDLRVKISNCIHKATTNASKTNPKTQFLENKEEEREEESGNAKVKVVDFEKGGQTSGSEEEEGDEEEEAERLLSIRDALESLENHLSHLQALQQQQLYEREVALAEIEHCRKILFSKLKEYKGEDSELIQEASAFVGETVEHDSDLLLPPYPSRLPESLYAGDHFLGHFPSSKKSKRNGVIAGGARKNLKELESGQAQNAGKGFGHVVGMAAKAMITIVGVISVLSISGFVPSLTKSNLSLKLLSRFQQPDSGNKRGFIDCPPGKVMVVEEGEARCIVKERVAVPFESAATKPDVNFGCG